MTQVVMTNSFRGGTGKTTIISNLASYLAFHGMKVIIVDADVISPGIHAIFGLDEKNITNTLTDYLNGSVKIEETVYDLSENLGLPEGQLLLVPSSMQESNIADFLQKSQNRDKVVSGIKGLTKAFEPDFIMIDTHPGLNREMLVMSGITDVMLNVVRPDNQDYQGLTVTSEVTTKLGLKSYIVLNKVHPRLRKPKLLQTVSKTFKLPVAGMLPHSEDILLSQSQFVFTDKYPNHIFSRAIYEIAQNVFGIKPKNHLEIMQGLLTDISEGKLDLDTMWRKERISKSKYGHYIDDLISEKFVSMKNRKLAITPKGQKFLNRYSKITKFVDGFRL